jgi:hypothetical protein
MPSIHASTQRICKESCRASSSIAGAFWRVKFEPSRPSTWPSSTQIARTQRCPMAAPSAWRSPQQPQAARGGNSDSLPCQRPPWGGALPAGEHDRALHPPADRHPAHVSSLGISSAAVVDEQAQSPHSFRVTACRPWSCAGCTCHGAPCACGAYPPVRPPVRWAATYPDG